MAAGAARPAAAVAGRRGAGGGGLRAARRGARLRVAARRADDPRLLAACERLAQQRARQAASAEALLAGDLRDRRGGRRERRPARPRRSRGAQRRSRRLRRPRHRRGHRPVRRGRTAGQGAACPPAAARPRGRTGRHVRRGTDDGVRAQLRARHRRRGHIVAALRTGRRRPDLPRPDAGRVPDGRPADHAAHHQCRDTAREPRGRHRRHARGDAPEQHPRHHRRHLPHPRHQRARRPRPYRGGPVTREGGRPVRRPAGTWIRPAAVQYSEGFPSIGRRDWMGRRGRRSRRGAVE